MKKPIPILLYHSISDEVVPKFRDWRVSIAAFREQMGLLHAQNYTAYTVSELVTHLANPDTTLPDKLVVVTFDDALCDFYQYAYPILRQNNIASTLYVPTAYVGHHSRWLADSGLADYPLMSWEELKDVSGNGVECGGHTHTHVQLDIVSRLESNNEITRCKTELEQHLQRPIHSFAYPHGFHNDTVRKQVIAAGYANACAVKNALSYIGDDTYTLARIFITPYMSLGDFEQVAMGQAPGLAHSKELLRTKLFRHVRRARMRLRK